MPLADGMETVALARGGVGCLGRVVRVPTKASVNAATAAVPSATEDHRYINLAPYHESNDLVGRFWASVHAAWMPRLKPLEWRRMFWGRARRTQTRLTPSNTVPSGLREPTRPMDRFSRRPALPSVHPCSEWPLRWDASNRIDRAMPMERAAGRYAILRGCTEGKSFTALGVSEVGSNPCRCRFKPAKPRRLEVATKPDRSRETRSHPEADMTAPRLPVSYPTVDVWQGAPYRPVRATVREQQLGARLAPNSAGCWGQWPPTPAKTKAREGV